MFFLLSYKLSSLLIRSHSTTLATLYITLTCRSRLSVSLSVRTRLCFYQDKNHSSQKASHRPSLSHRLLTNTYSIIRRRRYLTYRVCWSPFDRRVQTLKLCQQNNRWQNIRGCVTDKWGRGVGALWWNIISCSTYLCLVGIMKYNVTCCRSVLDKPISQCTEVSSYWS